MALIHCGQPMVYNTTTVSCKDEYEITESSYRCADCPSSAYIIRKDLADAAV